MHWLQVLGHLVHRVLRLNKSSCICTTWKFICHSFWSAECFQHFEVCWAEGNYPVTSIQTLVVGQGSHQSNMKTNIAWFDCSHGHLAAGCIFKQVAPASSLTWHITYVNSINWVTGLNIKSSQNMQVLDRICISLGSKWSFNCNQTVTVFT